jgi:hypothetical protein
MERIREVRSQDAVRNRLLRALPAVEWQSLQLHLQSKAYVPEELYHAGQPITGLYFPDTGLFCATIHQRSRVADRPLTTLLGNAAITGIDTIPGTDFQYQKVEALSTSSGWWLPAEVLRYEWKARGAFSLTLSKYFDAQTKALQQMMLCRHGHTTEQQLCALLLLAQDWSQSSTIDLSMDALATLLDTTYTQIVLSSSHLWKRGLLRFNNNSITVLNRPSLTQAACSCYSTIHQHFQTAFQADT